MAHTKHHGTSSFLCSPWQFRNQLKGHTGSQNAAANYIPIQIVTAIICLV